MKHYKGRPGGCTTRRRKSINKRTASERHRNLVMGLRIWCTHDEADCHMKPEMRV
jgi:hypothetical protein